MRNTDVFVDMSTYCNAGCPQCHRTEVASTDKADWLPLIKWTKEEFQRVYHPGLIRGRIPKIKRFSICGTWGDPAMSPELVDIVDYIYSEGPVCEVSINTNGSIRDEQWWYRLGLLGQKHKRRVECVFTVDGINQEMHSKYRQKTDLQKTLDHMEAFVDGGGYATVYTILFKHNEDYIEEIAELVKQHGAKKIEWVPSERFYYDPDKWSFVNSKGEQDVLERTVKGYGWKQL